MFNKIKINTCTYECGVDPVSKSLEQTVFASFCFGVFVLRIPSRLIRLIVLFFI